MGIYLRTKIGPLVITKRLEAPKNARRQSPAADIATACLLACVVLFLVAMFLIGHFS